MALSEKTKKADEQLRKELQSADIGKFKKLIRSVVAPTKKPLKAKLRG